MRKIQQTLSAIDPMLKWAVYALAATYFINYVLLGFVLDVSDYDQLSGYYEMAWRFWRSGNLIPHFNPYFCGGRPLGADPQIPIFHPFVILVPLLGPTWIVKLEFLGQLLFGLWGLWKYLGFYKCTQEQKVWALFAFAAGGGVVARFMVGHITLGYMFLLPLFFYFVHAQQERPSRKLFLGYVLLHLYAGLYKPNFLIQALLLIFCYTTLFSIVSKSIKPLLREIAATALSVLVSAVIYLPAHFYFLENPRKDSAAPLLIEWKALFANFLIPVKAVPNAWYGFGWIQHHEFSEFLGPGVVLLAVLGLRKQITANRIVLLGVLLFSIWIGMGAPVHEVHLQHIYSWFYPIWPGFKSIRAAPRFWFGAYTILVVCSAFAFQMPKKLPNRLAFLFLLILPLLGNAVVNLSKPTVFAVQTQWTAKRLYPAQPEFVEATDGDSYRFLRQGIGVLHCVENVQVQKAKGLRPGNLMQRGTDAGLKWKDWSTLEIDTQSTTPLLFNLNFAREWSFEGKGRLGNENGLLSVSPEQDHIKGILKYRLDKMTVALILSGIGLMILLVLAVRAV